MDYTQISSWDHLKRYGINALTGESDPFMLRVLCDLNEDGVESLANYFGAASDLLGGSLNPAWNSKVNDKPAVASILLDKDMLLPLAKWLLFAVDGFKYVLDYEYTLYGTNNDQYQQQNNQALHDYEMAYQLNGKVPDYTDLKLPYKVLRNCNYQGGAADRNTHQMTGRKA